MATSARSEPVIVVVHGTGDAPTDANSVTMLYLLNPPDEADETVRQWQIGERWWQAGSYFFRRLGTKLLSADGAAFDAEKAVVRIIWTGENLESSRNDAAQDLLQQLKILAATGAPIHILAHSHGGNVVRKAIDLAHRDAATLRQIASITCFGTPFFHYARTSLVTRVLNLGAIVILGGGLIVFQGWAGPTGSVFRQVQNGLLIGIAIVVMFLAERSSLRLGRQVFQGLRRRQPAAMPPWRNYVSAKDEAISLLSSLNARVSLMQNMGRELSMPELALGLIAGFAALSLGLVVGDVINNALRHLLDAVTVSSPQSVRTALLQTAKIVSDIAALVATGALLFVGWKVYWPTRKASLTVFDAAITAQLRKLAYGDDRGAGIASVETFPWPQMEAVSVLLPAAIDLALEAHISANTTRLWPTLRERLSAGAPLISQDWSRMVQDSLTWDELAHTVYYRVDSFIDLVAADLAATGHWRLRED